ncbi:hypothetical protein AURDEDRAFT_179257 [Auricularia subglabra TFB-10046 SS5]|nr:hypothetical protein AURDEDRAFT_179257 [Auricularia subglabra TFB-10046 SS5]
MLKRRREVSPPPANAYGTPLNPQQLYAPGSAEDREADERAMAPMPRAKRRRTAAPVLDGSQRGWATPPVPVEDDGEEDWTESDDDASAAQAHAHAQPAANYQSVNSLLHTLHQQRRTVHPTALALPTHVDTSTARWSPRATSHHHAAAGKILPQMTTAPSPRPYQGYDVVPKLAGPDLAGHAPGRSDTADEMENVRNRYEEMNRLLGSLVLRRRQPDSNGDGSGQGY